MGLSPEPCSNGYCFRLNFNISKFGYCNFDFPPLSQCVRGLLPDKRVRSERECAGQFPEERLIIESR